MTTVVGVSFVRAGKVYWFDPNGWEVSDGEPVIVETVKGTDYGVVAGKIIQVMDEQVVLPLRKVVRIATEEDRAVVRNNKKKEADAFGIAQEKITRHRLEMKLVEVEYVFDGSRIVFYFTANGRVDFRELVRDLASVFRARIELRQIGVRDEAKMIGGLGPCGRPICCRQFLSDFQPVSIKMAKEQNLSLNPTKISGLCGRLMCCLKYEQDHYACVHKCMPRVGKEVQTPEGTGTVVDVGVLKEQLSVRVQKKDGWEIQHYPFDSLEPHEQGEPWVLRQVEPPQPEIDDFIIREEPIPRQPQPAQERAPERRRPRPPRPKREDEEARAAHGEPSPAAPAQGEDEQHARPPRRRGGRRKAGRGGQGGGKPPAAES